jgi:hypothetical protein
MLCCHSSTLERVSSPDNVMSRRHSSVDLADPGWRHAGRECHDGKALVRAVAQGRGIPRRGAAVLRKAIRAEYTPFPRHERGEQGLVRNEEVTLIGVPPALCAVRNRGCASAGGRHRT